jgi:hypothetical protein
MHPHLSAQSGFEPDGALTGTFEVSLNRAVLPYREREGGSPPGGRVQDIGLGVVVDGSDPARADVVDLGSAEMRVVDITGPVVVMGWMYPSGLRSLCRIVSDVEGADLDRARVVTFSLAMRTLRNAGFGHLTRPSILRIGFRDICQDLDYHEGTAIRILRPNGGVVRMHLDYEAVTLEVRTSSSSPSPELELALTNAFPSMDLYGGGGRDISGVHTYRLALPVPRSLREAREALASLRSGLEGLIARFEPGRAGAFREMTGALGERDSLRSLAGKEERPGMEPIIARGSVASEPGLGRVH